MSRLVCIPSAGMALVQYCRDTSYLSVSAPFLFSSWPRLQQNDGREQLREAYLPWTRQANGITRSPCVRPTKFPTNSPSAIGASTATLQGALRTKRIKSTGTNFMQYKLMSRAWRVLWAALRSHIYKARKTTRRSSPKVIDAFSLLKQPLLNFSYHSLSIHLLIP